MVWHWTNERYGIVLYHAHVWHKVEHNDLFSIFGSDTEKIRVVNISGYEYYSHGGSNIYTEQSRNSNRHVIYPITISFRKNNMRPNWIDPIPWNNQLNQRINLPSRKITKNWYEDMKSTLRGMAGEFVKNQFKDE